ncbi:MAG TPA: potassium transporter TrkG [Parasegetibacter sp.]
MSKRLRTYIKWKRFFQDALVVATRLRQTILGICSWFIPLLSLVAGMMVIYDLGFNPFFDIKLQLANTLRSVILFLVVAMAIRFIAECFEKKKWTSRVFHLLVLVFFWYLYHDVSVEHLTIDNARSNRFFLNKLLLYGGVLFLVISESSLLFSFIYRKSFNPALLFVLSFLILILLGTGLLMLPMATRNGINLIDAFFTATSAVCVTGLQVVNVADFTEFGQVILLLLFQAGGLGVMTFAGLIGFAMAGGASFQSQLALKDMMNTDRLGTVIRTINNIFLVTFLFELAGAVAIYFSVDDLLFPRKLDKIFFSVFHSVSAFCNAGISTSSGGLYELPFRFNYSLHLIIAVMVILGGMGFPIVFNIYRYTMVRGGNLLNRVTGMNNRRYIPRLMNINTRLALVMTSFLLLIGFVTYFIFEQQASLQDHPTFWGKLVTSFFGAVTPRTAGFNTVDLTDLRMPTLMIFLLLMWIGTSPGSTGGGIKTTTAAVALLNMASVIRGKDRTEFYRTEISKSSINKAFAIMMISLLIIGLSVFFISLTDGDKGLFAIAFESFSAFSTAGMTLGITPELADSSKFVLICTMFIGRVGALTMFVAMVKQTTQKSYRYPKEDVAM